MPLRVGNNPEDGKEDEIQNPMPAGDRVHSVEDGVDPPSLEGAQSESEGRHPRISSPSPDVIDLGVVRQLTAAKARSRRNPPTSA